MRGRRLVLLVAATLAAPLLSATGTVVAAEVDCPLPPGPLAPRLAGPDRIATAAQAAAAAFADGDVDQVVVASATSWPDAAVGSALAAASDAPLLLTSPDRLEPVVGDVLDDLDRDGDRGAVTVVGGVRAISEGVAEAMTDAGWDVGRARGATRYETAQAAAAAVPGGPLVVTSGESWPDTAVGAAAAAARGGALALTAPDDASALEPLASGREVVVVGGTRAVADVAYGQLADVATTIRRLAGVDRVATAAAVAESRPDAPALVATASDWPDAVVAAAAAPRDGSTVLLTWPDALADETARQVAGRDVRLVGGAGAVPDHVAADLADAAAADPGAPTVRAAPSRCATVAGLVDAPTVLTVTASAGALEQIAVDVDGPADHRVEVAGGTGRVTVTPTAAGSVAVSLSGRASVEGAARRVRTGWTLDVAGRTPEGWLVAGGTGTVAGDSGRLVRYTVEIADGLEARQDLAGFVATVTGVLSDAGRGWTAGGDVRLQRVADPAAAAARVVLAQPATVDRLCARAGQDTAGRYSCWNGQIAALNAERWLGGVAHVPDLTLYRTYLVNHEVGHGLGHRHRGCPAPGALAPVMMQLTKSTYGCVPNPWPYP